MPIEVRLDSGVKGLSAAWIKKIIAGTLNAEKVKRRSVSVLLTDNRRIRSVNRKFLRHDYATDVISFGGGSDTLCDLVVSVQMARSVSGELGIPFKEELARYLVHGTLHLLGYDDGTKKDKIKMEGRQELILRKLLG